MTSNNKTYINKRVFSLLLLINKYINILFCWIMIFNKTQSMYI